MHHQDHEFPPPAAPALHRTSGRRRGTARDRPTREWPGFRSWLGVKRWSVEKHGKIWENNKCGRWMKCGRLSSQTGVTEAECDYHGDILDSSWYSWIRWTNIGERSMYRGGTPPVLDTPKVAGNLHSSENETLSIFVILYPHISDH